jgi:hypothetical protein
MVLINTHITVVGRLSILFQLLRHLNYKKIYLPSVRSLLLIFCLVNQIIMFQLFKNDVFFTGRYYNYTLFK